MNLHQSNDPADFRFEVDGTSVVAARDEHWDAFEALFGDRGACAGCWCMWFRVSRRKFEAQKGDANKAQMRGLFRGDNPPGLIAFRDQTPVGWVAVGPRIDFPRLEGSQVAKRTDDVDAWSVTCLFVSKESRNEGVATSPLRGAAVWAAFRGAEWIEGYAVDADRKRMPDVFAFHGPAAAYRAAGYEELTRPTDKRVVYRREAGSLR